MVITKEKARNELVETLTDLIKAVEAAPIEELDCVVEKHVTKRQWHFTIHVSLPSI